MRVSKLSKYQFMGNDSVNHILDGAREQMRLAVIRKAGVELKPIEEV